MFEDNRGQICWPAEGWQSCQNYLIRAKVFGHAGTTGALNPSLPRRGVMSTLVLMAIVPILSGCAPVPATKGMSSPQSASGSLFQYEREYLRVHPPPAPAAPAPTGTSAILRPHLETGQARDGSMVMTTPGTGLTQYLTQVGWKIQENWIPPGPTAGREAEVLVRFRVLRTGQIREIEIEKSSGSTALVASVFRAIQQSTPLPPFPTLRKR